MSHSPLVGFMKDEDGRLVYANSRFQEVFEPLLGEFLGKTDFDLWPAEVAAKIRADDVRVLSSGQSEETVDSVPGDGEPRTWLNMKFPFRMGDNAFLGGLSLDVTEREREKETTRLSEERFRRAFEHAMVGMAVNAPDGRFLRVNPALCAITGYSAEELLGMTFVSITHPDDLDSSARVRANALATGQTGFRVEKRYIRKDGRPVWVRVSVGIVRDASGLPASHIALTEDVTADKMAEELALLSERRWQLALNGSSDGIWDWDARENTVFYSNRYKEMLGYEDADLANVPETWEMLLHPQDLVYAREMVSEHLLRRTPQYRAEYRLRCKDGTYKWVLARGAAIWDADGAPIRLLGTHTDITERKTAEEQLVYQAHHDPLTGLVNRRYLFEQLEAEMNRARSAGTALSLCISDLDHFKAINDREGHQAGDDVLKAFANILKEAIRKPDVAARMGGDEFCVVLPGTDDRQAIACLNRVRDRLESIAFGGNSGNVYGVTASFGVAELGAGETAADLIEAADRALYQAKREGRNAVGSREL
jgi:diguanylate cyclase (GGDEF)-like protein/PAS domain S-box-containing protein